MRGGRAGGRWGNKGESRDLIASKSGVEILADVHAVIIHGSKGAQGLSMPRTGRNEKALKRTREVNLPPRTIGTSTIRKSRFVTFPTIPTLRTSTIRKSKDPIRLGVGLQGLGFAV
jgi:hypothetical protein